MNRYDTKYTTNTNDYIIVNETFENGFKVVESRSNMSEPELKKQNKESYKKLAKILRDRLDSSS